MNTLFEPISAAGIIARIDKIQPDTQALWGKMNAAQMLAHCQEPFAVFFGERQIKRNLVGRLIGGIAKRKYLKTEPWPRGLPTAKEFVKRETHDLIQEKLRLTECIRRFIHEGPQQPLPPKHPFFGKMDAAEWATLAYNHLNHHLEQFGV